MNREAFEAEARKHGFILDRLDKSGEYVQLITEQAWLMWQAATDAALSVPATAPAWHVAPTVPGLWMCNYGDLSVATVNQPDIDTFDPAYNTGGRWYGPIPEDKP